MPQVPGLTGRPIRFRCFDGKKMWTYAVPLLFAAPNKAMINVSMFANGSSNSFVHGILLQVISSCDSNKKQMCEGDIIEVEYFDGLPTTVGQKLIWRGTVIYGMDEAFHIRREDNGQPYSIRYGGSAIKRREIIGNIYENPELLQGEVDAN